MKKCVCCLRKLQLQKDCSGGNQSNNFKFVCLLSGSFQMYRAAFAYIIRCPCRCSGNGGSKRRSRPNSVFAAQSFPMQS